MEIIIKAKRVVHKGIKYWEITDIAGDALQKDLEFNQTYGPFAYLCYSLKPGIKNKTLNIHCLQHVSMFEVGDMIVEEAFMGLLEITKIGVENLRKLEEEQETLEKEWSGTETFVI